MAVGMGVYRSQLIIQILSRATPSQTAMVYQENAFAFLDYGFRDEFPSAGGN
jgi:hypothetical protein